MLKEAQGSKEGRFERLQAKVKMHAKASATPSAAPDNKENLLDGVQ